MHSRVVRFGFACVLLLTVVACSSPEKAIVGRWTEVGGDETMEFFKEGTINVSGQLTMAGTYKWLDKDRIKLELGGIGALAGPVVLQVAIKSDELTLTDSSGKPSKYKRSK